MLVVVLLVSLSPAIIYGSPLDIDYFVKNKKDDGYPSNNGVWKIDNLSTVYNYGLITKAEKTKYSNGSTKASVYEVMDLLTRLKYIEDTGKEISTMKSVYSELPVSLYSLPDYLKNLQITKAAFSRYLKIYLVNSNNSYLNSVELSDISDVSEKTTCYQDIIEVLRYGLLELDSNNKFYPNARVTYSDLMKVMARLINPYYRATTKLYNGDKIEIQSDTFPMYYRNYDEQLFIEITKERYYEADCFIAHITMADPCHLKTIYSNLNFSNYGMEINYMDKKIDPIFIVNGDFRSPYIVRNKDLGIIRHCKIVRDMKFSNILGMKKDGTLIAVNETNAQAVLDLDIRDTWTFGPWLVRNGKAIEGLDNGANHPRTFIGQKFRNDGLLEYYLIVAEGRSKYDAGLSNYEMGQILEKCGVDIGYNLDGGGSSVMMFDGKLLSRPSDGYFRADIDYIYVK